MHCLLLLNSVVGNLDRDWDAILLVFRGSLDLESLNEFLGSKPGKRPSIMFGIRESPQNFPMNASDTLIDNLVDLTFSHRRDSDIYFPYGVVFPRDLGEPDKIICFCGKTSTLSLSFQKELPNGRFCPIERIGKSSTKQKLRPTYL